ncbi:MAG: rhomboid family intramembrane serine protease [Paracoccaceae bacterium]
MFPIRDHNPSQRTPFVCWTLIALNVGIHVWQAMLPLEAVYRLYDAYAFFPARLTAGVDLWGLVTSQFLHGGWLHLAGNMLFLWVFGDNLEDEMGPLPFLAFYLASGIAAAWLQYLSEPFSTVPMIGASGAIAGVMGGYLLLFPRARVDVLIILVVIFRIVPIPAVLVLGIWFALQVFGGATATAGAGGVAYWAHAGGFLAGAAMTAPLWWQRGGPAFWRRTDGHPPHPKAIYRPTTVPKVRRRR